MTNERPGNLLKNDSNQPLTFLRIRVTGVRSEEGEARRQTSRAAATSSRVNCCTYNPPWKQVVPYASRRAVNCFTV